MSDLAENWCAIRKVFILCKVYSLWLKVALQLQTRKYNIINDVVTDGKKNKRNMGVTINYLERVQ